VRLPGIRAIGLLLYSELGRHAALAVHPVPEGDGLQVAAKIIAPGVVDALKVLGAAGRAQIWASSATLPTSSSILRSSPTSTSPG